MHINMCVETGTAEGKWWRDKENGWKKGGGRNWFEEFVDQLFQLVLPLLLQLVVQEAKR